MYVSDITRPKICTRFESLKQVDVSCPSVQLTSLDVRAAVASSTEVQIHRLSFECVGFVLRHQSGMDLELILPLFDSHNSNSETLENIRKTWLI